MPRSAKASLLLPVLIVLLLGAVVADIVRRAVGHTPTEAVAPAAVPADAARGASSAGTAAPGTAGGDMALSGSAAPPGITAADSARHAGVRDRILLEGGGTYLATMLAGGDSTLRRWPDERAGTPLRVAVIRQAVEGFREDFVSNVGWALGRWNGAQLPVQLVREPDTSGADIVVTWVARMDSNRTGRADVTWDALGRIRRVAVTLATHTPDGRLVVGSQMVALALHELGHALGLGHSPERADALFPETAAIELTDRDRRTARLLYGLPVGSFR
jgi:hypothetical protein